MQKNPLAVLISDEHYTLSSLPLAHAAMTQALRKAEALRVPLISCGDLLDSKAIIRAECANALIELFGGAKTRIIVLVGNHTLINEKGKEHSLNFLKPYADVIQSPVFLDLLGLWFIPYQSSPAAFLEILKGIPKGSTIIAHQGVIGADLGHYVKDSGAVPTEALADYRTILGHYHKAQDIKAGRPRKGAVGLVSYVGTPYSTSFSEANDGPKGFRILYSDGSLESVPTNLRKHLILNYSAKDVFNMLEGGPLQKLDSDDLVWFKVTGAQSELDKIKKQDVAKLVGHSNFKLDKIPTEAPTNTQEEKKDLKDTELLDEIIDRTAESATQKKALKALWRELLETT
jgi:hypothetical protein